MQVVQVFEKNPMSNPSIHPHPNRMTISHLPISHSIQFRPKINDIFPNAGVRGFSHETVHVLIPRSIFTLHNSAPKRIFIILELPPQFSKTSFVHETQISKTNSSKHFVFDKNASTYRVKLLLFQRVTIDERSLHMNSLFQFTFHKYPLPFAK